MKKLAVVVELFDVVYEAVKLPLGLDFFFASEAEAVELFVVGEVAENGFDHGHAVAVDLFAFLAVDAMLHPVGVIGFTVFLFDDERDLSSVAFAMVG